MKIQCTKCGSYEVYIEKPKEVEEEQTKTMDEFVKGHGVSTLAYKTTTICCKKCGYSITY